MVDCSCLGFLAGVSIELRYAGCVDDHVLHFSRDVPATRIGEKEGTSEEERV